MDSIRRIQAKMASLEKKALAEDYKTKLLAPKEVHILNYERKSNIPESATFVDIDYSGEVTIEWSLSIKAHDSGISYIYPTVTDVYGTVNAVINYEDQGNEQTVTEPINIEQFWLEFALDDEGFKVLENGKLMPDDITIDFKKKTITIESYSAVWASKKKITKQEALDKIAVIKRMIERAEALQAVTGSISGAVLDAIEGALNIVVPLTAFFGDFELTALLSNLEIWLRKKRLEQKIEDQKLLDLQSMSYSTPLI